VIEAVTYPAPLLVGDNRPSRVVGIILVIALGLFVTAALWFGGQPQALRLAVPVLATLIGFVLYRHRPVLFLEYALWSWFLSPLLRRLIDWRFGFAEPNFVLLTPMLISGLGGIALLPSRRNSVRPPAVFVLCGAAILYGFAVGILTNPSLEIFFGLVNWLCPMLLGFHLYSAWPLYEQHCFAIYKTFAWCALVLGLYGVYQFFFPPAWDRYWLESIMATSQSFGLPEPLQIRVWSSVNAPGPFANVMLVSLLLFFVVRSPLKLPAAIAGYLSFLLTVVRTAWLSWILGFLWLLKSSSPRVIARVIISLLVLLACLLPLINDSRLTPMLSDRINTFSDLRHDESYEARVDMYRILLHDAIHHPFGNGLKNLEVSHGMAVDSGILVLLFSLGWTGAVLFLLGVFSLFFAGQHRLECGDPFLRVAKAILIALFAQIVGGSVFVSVTGALFWVFAAMYLAGNRYHEASAQALAEAPSA
jgi:hypothetical protein